MLTEKEFYLYIEKLKPTEYELMSDTAFHELRHPGINYLIFNRKRFYLAIKYALKATAVKTPVICDVGVWPGAMLHILSDLLPNIGYSPVFHGCGLALRDDFKAFAKERFGAAISTINLDPWNLDFHGKGYPVNIPLGDGSADLVFVTDVIEHLVHPGHMLDEAFRILKPGGVIILTTPNLTRIGSVFKLLMGRTNFESRSAGYSNTEDEWRPHVREYSVLELKDMLGRGGFASFDSCFFDGSRSDCNVFSFRGLFADMLKYPFYLVPHLRDGLLLSARK